MTIPEPFAARIERLRALLNESEADLLLADHGELMAWITGYTVSETMYRAVLVGRDAPPWMVLRDLDAPQVSGQGWLADVEGFADWDDPFAAVAATIRRRGFASGRMVVDSASYAFTVHAHARLRAELPQAEFVHRPGVSDRLRAVKDETEIGLLRRAADIADRSMERLRSGIGPGVTVRQAGALAASSYLELGADGGHVGRICLGAGATGFLHAELDDRPLQAGDVLHAELVPRVKRYSARIMRPIAVVAPEDEAPASVQALVERLVFHQDRQFASMAAGAKAADVDAVLRDALVDEGIRERYENVTGYMLGIYGRTPRASDFSHTFVPTSDWPLQAGMVFHMYTSAEGIGISDTVLVTANGGERLTRTPRRLLVSPARDGAPGNHLAGISESRPGARDGQRVTGGE